MERGSLDVRTAAELMLGKRVKVTVGGMGRRSHRALSLQVVPDGPRDAQAGRGACLRMGGLGCPLRADLSPQKNAFNQQVRQLRNVCGSGQGISSCLLLSPPVSCEPPQADSENFHLRICCVSNSHSRRFLRVHGEPLPNMCKALSSNPSTAKKKKKMFSKLVEKRR
jgi:hypothetical protein